MGEDGTVLWAAGMRLWGRIDRLWSIRTASGNAAPALTVTAQLDVPIRFQGQWEDAETGLYYNRFRYYDPGSGGIYRPILSGWSEAIGPSGTWWTRWGMSIHEV